MGCQSEVYIGDDLVFSICTHDPDTGALTDADSAPAYRVYEEETTTPILTGTMDKLDDVNTLGFYTELIECTAANGFEHGKSYTVYIEATVDTDTGGIAYSFKAFDATVSDPTSAAIADAVLEELVADHKAVSGSLAEFMNILYSMARGKIMKSGDTYAFYDTDGSTVLFTATITASQRTAS